MLNYSVHLPDETAMGEAKARWNAVAKPLHSLGLLEDLIVRIAGIQGTADARLAPRRTLIFCGDHGVVRKGVTQTEQSVTALVAEAIARGESNVNRMAAVSGTPVTAVDAGMVSDVPGILLRKTRYGTEDLSEGPAMTRAEAEDAIQGGITLVRECAERGERLIAVGEMGIGNTTATAAICCVLLGMPVEKAVDRGAGLSDEGLQRKRAAVHRALAVNRPDPRDPLDVLSKVGGLELCAMAGAFLGGMTFRVPIIMDGVITEAAALAAVRICPETRHFMLASHLGQEQAAARILQELDLSAAIHANLALGEGTGAVALLPLLDMALAVYAGSHTFDALGMAPYTEQGGTV